MSVVRVVIDETAGIVHETTLIVWTDRIWESRRELTVTAKQRFTNPTGGFVVVGSIMCLSIYKEVNNLSQSHSSTSQHFLDQLHLCTLIENTHSIQTST